MLHPRQEKGDQFKQYTFVYRWVFNTLGYPADNSAQLAVDKIVDAGRLKEVYERCCYYDDQIISGEKTREHAQNALMKMLREEFGLKKK